MEGEQLGTRYRFLPSGRAPLGTAGSQLARAAGESMEFMEHRDYQPGDDLRRMNWSAFARSDKLVVKVFRQEVTPHLDLVLDGSKSMALEGTEKLRAALVLAAALSSAADRSGYHRRVSITRNGCVPVEGGGDRPSTWNRLDWTSSLNPAESFRIRPPVWRPHGIRAMISDYLWLGNPLEILNSMADRSAATLVIQVLAEDDVNPVGIGNQRLLDSETGEFYEVFVDAAGLERYRQNFQRHQQAWRAAARQVGATFLTFIAEDFCRTWDFSPFVQSGILSIG